MLDAAIRTVQTIPSVLSRVDALRTIAPALSKAHRPEAANYLVDAAIQIVRKLPENPVGLARTYSWLAMIQHQVGAHQAAQATLMLARDAALNIEKYEVRAYLLQEIGEALATTGAKDAAIVAFRYAASAAALNSLNRHWITEAMVRVGLTEASLNLIDYSDWSFQSGMFQALIDALLKRGDCARALAITIERGGA